MTTQLHFRGAYDIVGNDQVGILVLTNEEGDRQISFICEHQMVIQFGLRSEKTMPTDHLLPEVLWTVIKRYCDMQFMVLVNAVKGYEYVSYLCSLDNQVAIPMRASDAVLLAVVSGVDILMDTQLFNRYSTPYRDSQNRLSVPLMSLSPDMLHEALQKAVDEEDYEKASQLRDELRRREKDVME